MITTLDISVTTVKGIKDAFEAAGIVTETHYYSTDNLNWIFSTPYSDKVVQLIIENTSSSYEQHTPIVRLGDAYDGSTSVTNPSILNSVYYETGYGYNRVGSATLIVTQNIVHIHFAAASKNTVLSTLTFAKLDSIVPTETVLFFTTDCPVTKGNTATGINTSTGATALPFAWGLGQRITPGGNYYAMDFCVGSADRAIGALAGAKLIMSPYSAAAVGIHGKHAICPLANILNGQVKIESNLLIENVIE